MNCDFLFGLDMMPCRTTRSFRSWNRWWTRSRVDSSAPKIQIFSKTSRTCSSNTTGEKQTHSSCFERFSSHDQRQTSAHYFFVKLKLSDLICLSSPVSPQFQSVCGLWRLHEMPRESQPAVSGNTDQQTGAWFLFSLSCIEVWETHSAHEPLNLIIFTFPLKGSKGVDEDGDQEHRRHRKVLQRQNHHRVRHRGVGRRADRPEDPAAERAERGHRGNGPGPEEDVRRSHRWRPPSCLQITFSLSLCF